LAKAAESKVREFAKQLRRFARKRFFFFSVLALFFSNFVSRQNCLRDRSCRARVRKQKSLVKQEIKSYVRRLRKDRLKAIVDQVGRFAFFVACFCVF
jgi:hypothetical protein